ncbi:SWIM zinc finger family protein [Planococcus chinensis]|uniref:SWIM zinc finger family protein n=1 Tax=Planococcus chinensis TaxID=272917 RepID=A0ABW4QHB2_9BACL
MNLDNLERNVPAKIYNRGVDYFIKGSVQGLKQEFPNHWYAKVEGTEDYHVSVYLKDAGMILSTSCTCPFESDSLCKHEVAVCLAISHYIEENGPAEVAEVEILQQLKSLKKAELMAILEELTEQEPAAKTFLINKFSRSAGLDEAAARRIIRKSAARGIRRRFIEWDEVDQAVEGAWEVYDYAEKMDPLRTGEQMIRLYLTIVKECVELQKMADDSSGTIGSVISASLDAIGEVMEVWPVEFDEPTIDSMLQLLSDHILNHIKLDMGDAPMSLMDSAVQWVERFPLSQKIFDVIENIAVSDAVRNKTYHYEAERLRMFQLDILCRQQDGQAIEAFIKNHRQYPRIRKAEVQRAMDAGDTDGAVRLCKTYEEMDAAFPGLVQDWKMMRFDAYRQAGYKLHMRDLAFDLAAAGNEEYYHRLKELVPAESWPDTVERLLSKLANGYWQQALYESILITEGMTEKLLEHCRSNLREIEKLYPHLIEIYPHEVEEIFTAYIYQSIREAGGRPQYRAACGKIRKFGQALGREAAVRLVEEIRFAYPNRPALLDELSKL